MDQAEAHYAALRSFKVSTARVSPNIFSLLGVQPLHGRGFTSEEADQQERQAVISYRFWQARFGSAAGAIGAQVELDGRTSRIIGILPAGFQFGGLDADLWEPYRMYPAGVVSLSSCPVLLASEMSGSLRLLHYSHLGGG